MTANVVEEHGYFLWGDEPVPEPQYAPDSAVGGILQINNAGLIDLELHNVLPIPADRSARSSREFRRPRRRSTGSSRAAESLLCSHTSAETALT